MSGTSRIGGYGGHPGSGRDRARSESLARFCRGRRQGDVVSGVFLRFENETMGWALLEGEELLAELPAEGPRPVEGARIFFRVEALHPEVVLRMISGDAAAARLSVIMPSLPLSQEAGLYTAARDKLDSLLAGHGVTSALRAVDDVDERQQTFITAVAGSPALFAAFADSYARAAAMLRASASAGLVFFRHMPWLSGAATAVEVSLWDRGEAPVFAGATLASGHRLLLRGAVENGILRYRLSVIPSGAGANNATATPLGGFSPPPEYGEFRGMEPVRAFSGDAGNRAGDLVGRILALAADSGTMAVGRFSRRL